MRRTRWSSLVVLLVVVAAACSDLPTDPWGTTDDALPVWHGTLEFEADYSVRNGNLSVQLTAHNTGKRTLSGIFDGCGVELRAYRTPDHRDDPYWQTSWEGFGCNSFGGQVRLPPGDSASLGSWPTMPYSDLPSGSSYFTARIIFGSPPMRTAGFPAGEVYKEP